MQIDKVFQNPIHSLTKIKNPFDHLIESNVNNKKA